MCEDDKYRILELLELLLDAINIIQHRTSHINKSDDFLLTPDNMFILDGVCMKLIFIGESIKNIDRISKGELLINYPSIPWKEIMKMRDIIAHHYFKIDAEVVFIAVKEELNPLSEILYRIKTDLKDSAFK